MKRKYKKLMGDIELINLTSHEITIVGEQGETVKTIEPCGTVARLKTSVTSAGEILGVKLSATIVVQVIGLPEFEAGKFYIVSQWVKNSSLCRERVDLLVPTEMVRSKKGEVLGCKSLGI